MADEQASCPGCAATYHPACLAESDGRCGTIGCRSVVVERPARETRCAACGLPCGWCGSVVDDQASCPGCAVTYHAACLAADGRCGTVGCLSVVVERPAPASRSPRCAACGLPEIVLPLRRCPHLGRRYHPGCRSAACLQCQGEAASSRPDRELPPWAALVVVLLVQPLTLAAGWALVSGRPIVAIGLVAAAVGAALAVRRRFS